MSGFVLMLTVIGVIFGLYFLVSGFLIWRIEREFKEMDEDHIDEPIVDHISDDLR